MPPRDDDLPQGSGLLLALRVQARCISALMIRDMMRRYGRANIGFLWIVLEPLLLTAGVMIVWSLIKSPYERGVELLALVMTGYLPLTLWRHITGAGSFAFRQSMSLLYHRHITLIDTVLARMFLELAGTTAALLVVYGVLALAGLVLPPHDPGLAVLGWLSMGVLSIGVGLCFAVLTEYSEASERLIAPLQYIILPLSGCFFMVEWLPQRVRDVALWNPTIHCYEMFRAGILDPSVPTHYTFWYPALAGLVLTFIALGMIDAVRDKLHTG